MDYLHFTSLVNDWGSFLNERQSCYEDLLCDRSLKSLPAEHNSTIEQVNKSKAFTVFEIISSLYYRENFHSDLIAFFLDPVQNHGMGLLGIELLVNLVIKRTGWQISAEYYEDATVVREQGRIDILIYCCPLKVSEQRDIHPQCCCNGIADDFSEGKPLS